MVALTLKSSILSIYIYLLIYNKNALKFIGFPLLDLIIRNLMNQKNLFL